MVEKVSQSEMNEVPSISQVKNAPEAPAVNLGADNQKIPDVSPKQRRDTI